jgi:ADP-ribosylglycohydrolase
MHVKGRSEIQVPGWHGGDYDTLGTVACAVSGAYLGIEAIPQAWREKLGNRQYIEDLALELAGMR